VNCILIKSRERDVKALKNVKVYFKWVWNRSQFIINSLVFHFDDFNYGRRTATMFFLMIAILTQL